MKTLFVSAFILGTFIAGCGSDPLSHKISDDVIGALPGTKLKEAQQLKSHVDAAKQKWEIAKKKQILVEMEFEAAKRYAVASEYQLKATKEKLAIQNKGVPMKLQPGAVDQALKDRDLAKKNLEYRRLMAELYEKRVKHFYLKYHSTRAAYFEKVVHVVHSHGHEAMKKHKKSDFVRQSADRKTMVAEALEDVEKSEAAIKSLKGVLEADWAPSMSCKPTPQPAAPGGTTPPADLKQPETK